MFIAQRKLSKNLLSVKPLTKNTEDSKEGSSNNYIQLVPDLNQSQDHYNQVVPNLTQNEDHYNQVVPNLINSTQTEEYFKKIPSSCILSPKQDQIDRMGLRVNIFTRTNVKGCIQTQFLVKILSSTYCLAC